MHKMPKPYSYYALTNNYASSIVRSVVIKVSILLVIDHNFLRIDKFIL